MSIFFFQSFSVFMIIETVSILQSDETLVVYLYAFMFSYGQDFGYIWSYTMNAILFRGYLC